MNIYPTPLQLQANPTLRGRRLQFDQCWTWEQPADPHAVPCTASEAADALLEYVVGLEDQLSYYRRRAQLSDALLGSLQAEQLLEDIDTMVVQVVPSSELHHVKIDIVLNSEE